MPEMNTPAAIKVIIHRRVSEMIGGEMVNCVGSDHQARNVGTAFANIAP
jgi:hypothetical protein